MSNEPTTRKCLQCGGEIHVDSKTGMPTCIYCGTEYKNLEGGFTYELEEIVNRRQMREFVEAEELSRALIEKQPECAEAYWQALLATLGVVYVRDEGKAKPTFFCYSYDKRESVFKNEYYLKAIENSDADSKEFYEKKAGELDKLLDAFFALVAKEAAYDVFISFKKTTVAIVDGEERSIDTDDYLKAKEIYDYLTKRNFKVFFSPVSIGTDTGIEGEKYEPRILKALQSSKAMILVGTKKEYLEAQWVENEWRRYLFYIKRGLKKKNSLIIGYEKQMPALPLALKDTQWPSFDFFKSGYLEDLVKKLDFVKPTAKPKPEAAPVVKKPKKKMSKRAKIAVAVICALLLGGAAGGFIYYNSAISEVEEVSRKISSIPYTITDYEYFSDLINETYTAYTDLADWQKEKVEDKERFLEVISEFDKHKADRVLVLAGLVSVETVETTTALYDAVTAYRALTPAQKAKIPDVDIKRLDAYASVYDIITGIKEVEADLTNKYSKVADLKQTYHSLSAEYTALVYNYHLVDTFEEKYAFMQALEYTELDDGSYSVKAKDTASLTGKVEIPERYNGQLVTVIPDEAFKDCKGITEVVVPETVTEIGRGAFSGCTKITDMTLPFTGKSKNAEAFEAVMGFIFGYTTRKLDTSGESSTEFINTVYEKVDGATWQYTCKNAGYGDCTVYYYYVPVSLKNITITTQTEIKSGTFNGLAYIESVNYTQTLDYFGDAIFQDCASLKRFNSDIDGEMDLTSEVQIIRPQSFKNCSSIDKLTMPSGLLTIYENAFENLSVTSLLIPDSVEDIHLGAFANCKKLVSLTLPFIGASVNAEAYDGVLGHIFGRTSYKIDTSGEESKTFINTQHGSVDGATWQYTCKNGGYGDTVSYYFYIPSTLKEITVTEQSFVPIAAFNGCSYVEKITFLTELTEIKDAAMQNCASLTFFNSESEKTVDLSGAIAGIGNYAFYGCKTVTDVIFHDNNRTLGNYAFAECANITEVNLNNHITSIGDYVFAGLPLITEVTVYDSTTNIGLGAFKGCVRLKEMSLPFTGRSLNSTAFDAVFGFVFGYQIYKIDTSGDINNTFINAKHGEVEGATWQYTCRNASYGDTNSYHYYIPESVKKVTITNQDVMKCAAFNGCKYIESITYVKPIDEIEDATCQDCVSLKTFNSETAGEMQLLGTYILVGDYAFKNCDSITSLTLSDSLRTINDYGFEGLSITELVIPEKTETIHIGAFKGCDKLQKFTAPFIGKSEKAEAFEATLGFVFGYQTYKIDTSGEINTIFINTKHGNVEGATWQYTCRNASYGDTNSYYYYIPMTLETVVITKQDKVPIAAFNGCSMINVINFVNAPTSEGECAYQGCNADVIIGTLPEACQTHTDNNANSYCDVCGRKFETE